MGRSSRRTALRSSLAVVTWRVGEIASLPRPVVAERVPGEVPTQAVAADQAIRALTPRWALAGLAALSLAELSLAAPRSSVARRRRAGQLSLEGPLSLAALRSSVARRRQAGQPLLAERRPPQAEPRPAGGAQRVRRAGLPEQARRAAIRQRVERAAQGARSPSHARLEPRILPAPRTRA